MFLSKHKCKPECSIYQFSDQNLTLLDMATSGLQTELLHTSVNCSGVTELQNIAVPYVEGSMDVTKWMQAISDHTTELHTVEQSHKTWFRFVTKHRLEKRRLYVQWRLPCQDSAQAPTAHYWT